MATRLIALFLVCFGLLPIANWIPGGESDPEYAARLLDWANGFALCAVAGILGWYLVRARARHPENDSPTAIADLSTSRANPVAAEPHGASRSSGRIEWRGDLLLAAAATTLYALIAHLVFSARPLLIDEIVQVLQARWYAAGHLSVPTPEPREFFSILHLVDLGERTYSQFPAGGPAMLALGSLAGAEWLVGPLAGGVSVLLFARLIRLADPIAGVRWHRSAAMLFSLAPFGAFMFGSHMNHGTVLPWLLLAIVALATSASSDDASPGWGFVLGSAFGIAATIRPVDAAAFALPAAGWVLWRARRGGRPLALAMLALVGIAGPLLVLFLVNAATTGSPLLFGYDVLWGSGHGLGFHRSPWGPMHTPWRGVELISLYVTRLSVYLFESPFPAILPAAAALAFSRKLSALDRYLLASAGALLLGYWAYWHDGFYLGPRFLFPLLPVLVLWSARLPRLLRVHLGSNLSLWSGVRIGIGTGAVYALVTTVVVRAPQYRNGMTSMRTPIERSSAQADVRNALVLVKESWGAGLMVRMWARGLSRSDSEVLYRNADACKLDRALAVLEVENVRGASARDRLAVLRTDSLRLVKSTRSPDLTERMLPDFIYAPECETAIAEDRLGFLNLAPLRLAQDGNVYARWLPGREAEIAALYPERDVYLLGRTGREVDAPLRWTRLRSGGDASRTSRE